ncbi:MAG: hypothetical protein R6X32_21075 [Chloroflexota bacterium]
MSALSVHGHLIGQRIRYGRNEALALGDVIGNGQLDLFIAGLRNYQVW